MKNEMEVKSKLAECKNRLQALEECGRGFERQELTREIKTLEWVLKEVKKKVTEPVFYDSACDTTVI